MTTMQIAKRLVELCQMGKSRQAMTELYSPDIVSIEAGPGSEAVPKRIKSLAAVNKKADWWEANHTIHSIKIEGPWPNDDKFIVRFIYDVTGKAGPMAGMRITLDEAALYTVKDAKIVEEEFFYSMGE